MVIGQRRSWPANFLCPAPDLWLTGDRFMGKLSAVSQPTRPTWPSIPPGSVNGSNPCVLTLLFLIGIRHFYPSVWCSPSVE